MPTLFPAAGMHSWASSEAKRHVCAIRDKGHYVRSAQAQLPRSMSTTLSITSVQACKGLGLTCSGRKAQLEMCKVQARACMPELHMSREYTVLTPLSAAAMPPC